MQGVLRRHGTAMQTQCMGKYTTFVSTLNPGHLRAASVGQAHTLRVKNADCAQRNAVRTRVILGEQSNASQAPTQSVSVAKKKPDNKDYTAYAALLGVALLWGSYTPAIRILFTADIGTTPDPPLMNALQACLSAAFLVFANVTASLTTTKFKHPERANPLMAEDSAMMRAVLRRDREASKIRIAAEEHHAAADAGVAEGYNSDLDSALPSPTPASSSRRPASNPIEHAIAEVLNWRSNNLYVAGAEIGTWMSLAFSLEVLGLAYAGATKVAFLNQVSVLITPLLVHLSGERVRGLEWAACGMGLLGSVLVAVDSIMNGGGGGAHGGHAAADAAQSNEVLGLIFVLISALFFALSTVRLGRYSSQFDALQLSTISTSTLGALSLVWMGVAIQGQPDGIAHELSIVSSMLGSGLCVATLIWVGLGPGALAAYLQATGQKSVPPAQAQVIYSTTPLWAAAFAYLALDASDEAMGSIAWAGAAVMLGSSLLTALLPADDSGSADSNVGMSSLDSDMDESPLPVMVNISEKKRRE